MHPIPFAIVPSRLTKFAIRALVCGEGRGLALDCGNVNAEESRQSGKLIRSESQWRWRIDRGISTSFQGLCVSRNR
jgi:hypothetical protein